MGQQESLNMQEFLKHFIPGKLANAGSFIRDDEGGKLVASLPLESFSLSLNRPITDSRYDTDVQLRSSVGVKPGLGFEDNHLGRASIAKEPTGTRRWFSYEKAISLPLYLSSIKLKYSLNNQADDGHDGIKSLDQSVPMEQAGKMRCDDTASGLHNADSTVKHFSDDDMGGPMGEEGISERLADFLFNVNRQKENGDYTVLKSKGRTSGTRRATSMLKVAMGETSNAEKKSVKTSVSGASSASPKVRESTENRTISAIQRWMKARTGQQESDGTVAESINENRDSTALSTGNQIGSGSSAKVIKTLASPLKRAGRSRAEHVGIVRQEKGGRQVNRALQTGKRSFVVHAGGAGNRGSCAEGEHEEQEEGGGQEGRDPTLQLGGMPASIWKQFRHNAEVPTHAVDAVHQEDGSAGDKLLNQNVFGIEGRKLPRRLQVEEVGQRNMLRDNVRSGTNNTDHLSGYEPLSDKSIGSGLQKREQDDVSSRTKGTSKKARHTSGREEEEPLHENRDPLLHVTGSGSERVASEHGPGEHSLDTDRHVGPPSSNDSETNSYKERNTVLRGDIRGSVTKKSEYELPDPGQSAAGLENTYEKDVESVAGTHDAIVDSHHDASVVSDIMEDSSQESFLDEPAQSNAELVVNASSYDDCRRRGKEKKVMGSLSSSPEEMSLTSVLVESANAGISKSSVGLSDESVTAGSLSVSKKPLSSSMLDKYKTKRKSDNGYDTKSTVDVEELDVDVRSEDPESEHDEISLKSDESAKTSFSSALSDRLSEEPLKPDISENPGLSERDEPIIRVRPQGFDMVGDETTHSNRDLVSSVPTDKLPESYGEDRDGESRRQLDIVNFTDNLSTSSEEEINSSEEEIKKNGERLTEMNKRGTDGIDARSTGLKQSDSIMSSNMSGMASTEAEGLDGGSEIDELSQGCGKTERKEKPKDGYVSEDTLVTNVKKEVRRGAYVNIDYKLPISGSSNSNKVAMLKVREKNSIRHEEKQDDTHATHEVPEKRGVHEPTSVQSFPTYKSNTEYSAPTSAVGSLVKEFVKTQFQGHSGYGADKSTPPTESAREGSAEDSLRSSSDERPLRSRYLTVRDGQQSLPGSFKNSSKRELEWFITRQKAYQSEPSTPLQLLEKHSSSDGKQNESGASLKPSTYSESKYDHDKSEHVGYLKDGLNRFSNDDQKPGATEFSSQESAVDPGESERLFVRSSISDSIKKKTGLSVESARIFRGKASDRILSKYDADGLSDKDTILIRSDIPEVSPDFQGLLAHELVHKSLRLQERPSALRENTATTRNMTDSMTSLKEEEVALEVENQVYQQVELEYEISKATKDVEKGHFINQKTDIMMDKHYFSSGVDRALSKERNWGGLPAPWEAIPLESLHSEEPDGVNPLSQERGVESHSDDGSAEPLREIADVGQSDVGPSHGEGNADSAIKRASISRSKPVKSALIEETTEGVAIENKRSLHEIAQNVYRCIVNRIREERLLSYSGW